MRRSEAKWLQSVFFFFFFQGYHRPNHYIATQGKNKKIASHCELECVGGESLRHGVFIRWGVGWEYLTEHPPSLFTFRSCKLLFHAKSSVRSGNLVSLCAHLLKHAASTRPPHPAASFPLQLPSVLRERLIRQSGRERWINKWISWHVQTHFVTVLIWTAVSRGKERLPGDPRG